MECSYHRSHEITAHGGMGLLQIFNQSINLIMACLVYFETKDEGDWLTASVTYHKRSPLFLSEYSSLVTVSTSLWLLKILFGLKNIT